MIFEKPRYLAQKAALYVADFGAYMRDAAGLSDLLNVSRVRLSLSKVGPVICPKPITPAVRLRSFGKAPLHLRSHTTDISVLNEILVAKTYQALLAHPRSEPALIVDLGANIGLVDRWLLNLYPNAEIIAVEPEPGNAAILRANVAGLQVRVVEACIGATARSITLHTTGGAYAFTMVGEASPDAVSVTVPVVTMQTVLQGAERIDLLKVDIEGAEEELFDDCAEWIGNVELLLVECHAPYKVSNLEAALKKAGVTFRVLDLDATPGWPFETALLEQAR